ncbi:PPE family protein, partial [Mycobacterium persicum]|uniref:PPE family protein n=1 Tax=Mycobacterium persicum TaxID=1487726 RepID=UPI0013C2FB74
MNFLILPPEINSAQIFAGAGAGPMLQAATAWDGLATELRIAADSFGSVASGLVHGSWQGAASAAMAAAATPYVAWLQSAAAQAEQAAGHAKIAVDVYEAVRTEMVHPALVAANRSSLVRLVWSNLFGQNAPAIATAEAQYEEMWAQDVAAMLGYHSTASTVATALAPFTRPLQSLAGQAMGLLNGGSSIAAGAGAAPAAAVAAPTGLLPPGVSSIFNIGFANFGGLNFGNANLGDLNQGNGNLGNLTFGSGNLGSVNLGSGNLGNFNVGLGNLGSNNFGFGNNGGFNIGFGNTGSGNIGIGLSGDCQVGFGGR